MTNHTQHPRKHVKGLEKNEQIQKGKNEYNETLGGWVQNNKPKSTKRRTIANGEQTEFSW